MTNRVDVNNVLAEIRNIRAQMQQTTKVQNEIEPANLNPSQKVQELPEFNQMFKQAIDQVSSIQKNSGSLQKAYEQGDPEVDLTQVMIASQKSSVAFQALTQVRNRVVKAYEDIMKMPI